MNVAALARDSIQKFGEYVSLHSEGRSFTNLQLETSARSLARVLLEHGVEPGDRVLIMMPNGPETMTAFQAIWTIGAVVCPITPQLKAHEVEYLIKDSGARVALTITALAPVLREASAAQPGLGEILPFESLAPELLAASPVSALQERQPSDMALLLYTSGTTGHPKGVMITHGNLWCAVESCTLNNLKIERCASLLVLPLSHVYGVLMWIIAVAWGFTIVAPVGFDIAKVLRAIQDHRIERLSVVPAILIYLLNYPDRDKYDTSSIRKVLSGGAPLPEYVREQFENVFHCQVNQGYGMSETAAIAAGYADDEAYRPGSAGRAAPLLELKIVGPDLEPLPPRQAGEICVRGGAVMSGYWNNPEATTEAIRDGWIHTGDVGYLDEDGYLFITDRKKDLIIKGGENISPREIEEVVHEHPAVASAVVIGVPDILFGENICAVVTLKPGCTATADEIREHTGKYLTKFKIPALVRFEPSLPINAAGKILKRTLRERLGIGASMG